MNNPYRSLNRYILRTPILPFNFYKNLTNGDWISNKKLLEAINRQIIDEAIYLASPGFHTVLNKWKNGELDLKKEGKLRLSLLKYLSRMSSRCTPFGLFAGCTTGTFQNESRIINSTPEKNKRHTRLDMNYLVNLVQDLDRNPNVRNELRYYVNSSLYYLNDEIRFIEYYFVDGIRKHRVVEVDRNEYLDEILNKARKGISLNQAKEILILSGIQENDANSYVLELIDSQILMSELEPSVTGMEFTYQIEYVLKNIPAVQKELKILKKAMKQLKQLDRNLVNDLNSYTAVRKTIEKIKTPFNLKFLIQTDLELNAESNTLSSAVSDKVEKALTLLNKLSVIKESQNLIRFKEEFIEKYEEREMPLPIVLDVELGIGYGNRKSISDLNPLIDDLVLVPIDNMLGSEKIERNHIHKILEKKLIMCDRNSQRILYLNDEDFDEISCDWSNLPDTLPCMIQIAHDGKSQKIRIIGVGGSSATNLISRFCYTNKELFSLVQHITNLEQRMHPNAILAEVLHLPESRVGNILMRPSFRDYEIPYLAKSSKPLDKQIPISDLLVSIRQNRVVLRSKRLNKEVIPRLSNAHNFSYNSLPIYHFLCDLQTQDLKKSLNFSFDFLGDNRKFLPRVEYGDIIIHLSKWKFSRTDIIGLLNHKNDPNELKNAIAEWKDLNNLPTHILLIEGDNELLINLNNATCVSMMLEKVKNKKEFEVSEFLFEKNGIVKGETDYYTNQMIIPFYNSARISSNDTSTE